MAPSQPAVRDREPSGPLSERDFPSLRDNLFPERTPSRRETAGKQSFDRSAPSNRSHVEGQLGSLAVYPRSVIPVHSLARLILPLYSVRIRRIRWPIGLARYVHALTEVVRGNGDARMLDGLDRLV